eukprot:gene12357-8484_t
MADDFEGDFLLDDAAFGEEDAFDSLPNEAFGVPSPPHPLPPASVAPGFSNGTTIPPSSSTNPAALHFDASMDPDDGFFLGNGLSLDGVGGGLDPFETVHLPDEQHPSLKPLPQGPHAVSGDAEVEEVENPIEELLALLPLEKACPQPASPPHDKGVAAAVGSTHAPGVHGVAPTMTPELIRFFLPGVRNPLDARLIVVNIIAQVYLNVGIDLPAISCALRTVEYNPSQRVASGILRLNNPDAVVIIRNSGALSILGARSVAEARQAAELAARLLRKVLHLDLNTFQFRIRSISARFNTCSPVRLESLAAHTFQRRQSPGGVSQVVCHYEPERFTGCTVRMIGESHVWRSSTAAGGGVADPSAGTPGAAASQPPAPKRLNSWCISCLVFVTGKLTFLGARSEEELRFAFDAVIPILSLYLGSRGTDGAAPPPLPGRPQQIAYLTYMKKALEELHRIQDGVEGEGEGEDEGDQHRTRHEEVPPRVELLPSGRARLVVGSAGEGREEDGSAWGAVGAKRRRGRRGGHKSRECRVTTPYPPPREMIAAVVSRLRELQHLDEAEQEEDAAGPFFEDGDIDLMGGGHHNDDDDVEEGEDLDMEGYMPADDY